MGDDAKLPKAEYVRRASRRVMALLASVEHRLIDSIERAERRATLAANAKLVRHAQLLVLKAKKLSGSSTTDLADAKATWERMSIDDIIAAYAKKQRD